MDSEEKALRDVGGRPAVYTEELGEAVLAELAAGKSMVKVCKMEGMPHRATIFRWMRTVDGFSDRYDQAKDECADYLAEEALDIADDGTNDFVMNSGNEEAKAAYKINGEAVQRSRLRVDTRKWFASKLKPKKYGEKVQTENLNRNIDLTGMTDAELQKELDDE